MSDQLFEKTCRAGFWALAAAAILPFCILCFYNQPLGLHEWDWITDQGGKFAGVGFLAHQKYFYFDCTGRFASTAIMALTPFWYSGLNFQLVFLANLAGSLWAIFFLLKKIFPAGAGRLSVGIFLLYLSKTSGVFDSIYRFSGIVTYQFGGIFLLILLGMVAESLISQKIGWAKLALCCALGFMTAGMNEVSMVAANLIWAVLIFARWKTGLATPRWFWAVGFWIVAGSILAVAAPGNFNRMDTYSAPFGLVDALATTFGCVVFSLAGWFSEGALPILTILSIPILLKYAQKPAVKNLFSSPLAWLSGSLVFVYLAYFPMIFGTKGMSFAERVVDFAFLHFCFGWLGFAQSCTVKLVARSPQLPVFLEKRPFKIGYAALAAAFFLHLFVGKLEVDRVAETGSAIERIQTTSNIGQIYLVLLDGSAASYREAVHRQYEAIKHCKSDTCLVERPEKIPPQLYEKISDRRNKPRGEPFMGGYFNPNVQVVRYENVVNH